MKWRRWVLLRDANFFFRRLDWSFGGLAVRNWAENARAGEVCALEDSQYLLLLRETASTYEKEGHGDDEEGDDSPRGRLRVIHCEDEEADQAVPVHADGDEQKAEEEGELWHVGGFA